MRTLNLLPIWALIGFGDWIYELAENHQYNSSLYVALGIIGVTLLLNYVFFGKITLWHKQSQKNEESQI